MALDPSIVLLIGAETGLLDESSYARALTAAGNAARTTAQAKYGTASLTFDGIGDRVQLPLDSGLWFGSGDFTVEGWFRFVTKTTDQALMGHWDNSGSVTNSSWFLYIVGGVLKFRGGLGGTTRDLDYAWVPTLGQWYHLAAVRGGTTLRLYVDGVVVATDTSYSVSLNACGHPLTLGAIGTTGTFAAFDFNGQMDEVRITKGLAQYGGAFTPAGPFPRDTPVTVTTGTIGTTAQLFAPTPTLLLPAPVQVTQLVAELLVPVSEAPVAATQVAVELVLALGPQPDEARVTQIVCELIIVLRPIGPCVSGAFLIEPGPPDYGSE